VSRGRSGRNDADFILEANISWTSYGRTSMRLNEEADLTWVLTNQIEAHLGNLGISSLELLQLQIDISEAAGQLMLSLLEPDDDRFHYTR
jgi:hypothetical protein